MQQFIRPNSFFLIFRVLRYLPYIAIGLLFVAIAIWVIFGIKKYKWSKILAIVLTVLVLITGLCSLGTLALGRFRGDFPQDGVKFRRFEDRENTSMEMELNVNDSGIDFK
jgi:thiol:disulfide interchange protein